MKFVSKNIKNLPELSIALVTLSLIMVSALPVNAGINFNYSNTNSRNYTIPDAAMNSNNFVTLTGGNIEMPSITLKFGINKTLSSGTKSLVINTSTFGPRTTDLPNQKVYTLSGSTAAVSYTVNASGFANTAVNISTYRQVSGNIPFFSDFSIALLNFDDLKNTWNNDTEVLDEFITAASDENIINETSVTLDASGNYGTLSQNLAAGNYLILVTTGTDPKSIITWNIVKVVPFGSTVTVGNGSGTA